MSEQFWATKLDESAEENAEGWVDEPAQQEDLPSNNILSLLNLGELKARIDVRGHEVVIHTLKIDDELEIGRLIQPYQGTIEEGRALATALVSASIETIDGVPLVAGLGPSEDLLSRRFKFVRSRMYWPVIREIYEEGYIRLVEQQVQALEEFRKK
jgi:hypothetical protein